MLDLQALRFMLSFSKARRARKRGNPEEKQSNESVKSKVNAELIDEMIKDGVIRVRNDRKQNRNRTPKRKT